MTYATASLARGSSTPRRKVWNGVLWALQLAAAGMFLSAGANKLAGDPAMVQAFQAIGLGQWFRYLTGGLEVIGAVLLVVPALAGLGALLLAGVMVGAVLTHLFVVGGSALPALVLLLAMIPIALLRRERTLELLQRIIR
jgi:putative oxidoreductase